MTNTTVLENAHVLCMDDGGTQSEAVAFRDGELIAVGNPNEFGNIFDDADVHDLRGALVLPGFVDAHHHVSVSALYNDQIDIGPTAVDDIASLQQVLAEAAKSIEPGQWLVATNWDEHQLAERRPPTRHELDEAVGEHPLFALHYTCHRALANSRALRLAGIDSGTADPPGGIISRAGKQPDGLLIERGMSSVEALARASLLTTDRVGFLNRLAQHFDRLLEMGITCVADTAVPLDVIDVYREAARRGEVPITTVLCPVSQGGWLEEPWDVLGSDLEPGPTPDEAPLVIGPVKLVFDGAPQCSMCLSWWSTAGVVLRTAALAARRGSFDPIRATMSTSPRPGIQFRSGIDIYRSEEANRVVAAVSERGFGVATHAIGNAAIDVALSAYEATGARVHDGGNARLEHASFLDRDLVRRIADVGAVVVAQPDFVRLPAYADTAPIPGIDYFPLRSLLDAGVLVAGSSDYPVAGFDPLDGVRSAVRRRCARGDHRAPEQRIAPREALALYTRNAAKACGQLDRCGTLEVGKRADLVVLDGDLDDLDSLRVRTTYVGGEVTWTRA